MRLGAARITALALFALVLILLVSRLDLGRVGQTFSSLAWPWVLFAAVVNLANTLLEATRWRLILTPLKPGASVRTAVRAVLIGTVGNCVLPFKLGEGVRAYALAKLESLPLAGVLPTVALDRAVDVTALLLLTAVAGFVWPVPSPLARIAGWAVAVVGVVAVLLVLARIWAPADRAGRLPGTSKLAVWRRNLVAGLGAVRDVRLVVPIALLAVLSWTARLMVFWSMGQALGLTLPLSRAALVLLVTNFAIASVATPANLGTFEASSAMALKLFSVPNELAVTYAVALHATEVVPVAILGLIAMWQTGVRLTALKPERLEAAAGSR